MLRFLTNEIMENYDINLKTILNSRNEKTLEAEIKSIDGNFSVKASAPSGKSRGSREAFVLETNKALKKFEELKPEILKFLAGGEDKSQKQFDEFLIELDGAENKSNLGGNLILVLSLAFARLKAKNENQELFQYIRRLAFREKNQSKNNFSNFPKPIFNVINGGAHSYFSRQSIPASPSSSLTFQEFQIVPQGNDFELSFSLGLEFYRKLGEELAKKFSKENIHLGEEAGYSVNFRGNEEALGIIADLIEIKKYPLNIGLDAAATQFFRKEKNVYEIEKKEYSAEKLTEYYLKLIRSFNIVSLEDPFQEEDFDSFALLASKLGGENTEQSPLIIADDLTATNIKWLKTAVEEKSGNAVLIKPNQIGTLTETLETARFAKENNWQVIASHRSGETLDGFIADLAVGINAWGIKAGAPAKPERLAKYERLLKIYQSSKQRKY